MSIKTAIILAGGKGSRMKMDIPKQFLELEGYPLLYYSLKVFQESIIDNIIVVTSKEYIEFVRNDIIQKYGFTKVIHIVQGGKERYNSVYNGLLKCSSSDYVFIHDGARPFIDNEIIENAYAGVKKYKACVVGMPVKDTIKLIDSEGFCNTTPDRDKTWLVQTPQVFEYALIRKAYDKLLSQDNINATDDAMAVEQFMQQKVKIIEGSYDNIKITTPQDINVAKTILGIK